MSSAIQEEGSQFKGAVAGMRSDARDARRRGAVRCQLARPTCSGTRGGATAGAWASWGQGKEPGSDGPTRGHRADGAEGSDVLGGTVQPHNEDDSDDHGGQMAHWATEAATRTRPTPTPPMSRPLTQLPSSLIRAAAGGECPSRESGRRGWRGSGGLERGRGRRHRRSLEPGAARAAEGPSRRGAGMATVNTEACHLGCPLDGVVDRLPRRAGGPLETCRGHVPFGSRLAGRRWPSNRMRT
jgi:hypothetical protein